MPNVRISVICAKTTFTQRHLFPLIAFEKQLKSQGIQIDYYQSLNHKEIMNSDVALFLSVNIKRIIDKPTDNWIIQLIPFLEQLKANGVLRVMFDAQDSSGRILKQVVDNFDLLLKPQLLKDRNQYTKTFYGSTIFNHYYHENYNLEDEQVYSRQPLVADDIQKLKVGWSLGLLDWYLFNKVKRGANRILRNLLLYRPRQQYSTNVSQKPLVDRSIDVAYRVSYFKTMKTTSYQRETTYQALEELAAQTDYDIRYNGKVSGKLYDLELFDSKVAPSPFGQGEICYRDFEAFASGAVLLKPDMSHLETWPNYYQPDKTYITHKWDFSDFDEKLIHILEHPHEYQEIATSGQKVFMDSLSDDEGGEAFAEHFLSIIESL